MSKSSNISRAFVLMYLIGGLAAGREVTEEKGNILLEPHDSDLFDVAEDAREVMQNCFRGKPAAFLEAASNVYQSAYEEEDDDPVGALRDWFAAEMDALYKKSA